MEFLILLGILVAFSAVMVIILRDPAPGFAEDDGDNAVPAAEPPMANTPADWTASRMPDPVATAAEPAFFERIGPIAPKSAQPVDSVQPGVGQTARVIDLREWDA